jgi:peroxiredoxin
MRFSKGILNKEVSVKDNIEKEGKGGAPAPPPSLPKGVCLLVVLLLFCGLLTGMGSKPPQVGGLAPPFTLNDLKGRPVSLADYKGKVVLLNFWATWCEPCRKEMPEIQTAYEQFQDRGLVVLAVNFGENLDPAVSFVHHGNLTFPVLLDRKASVAERYGVINLPVTFLIDPEGIIRDRIFGGTLTAKGIGEAVQRLQQTK